MTTSISIIGGSWHGHAVPPGPTSIRLIKRSTLEQIREIAAFPEVSATAHLDYEVYHLHTIRHVEGVPTAFYSLRENGSEAVAELLGHACGSITTDMIRAALQSFAGPVYYMDAAGNAAQVVDQETGEAMVKTMWTRMQRARR